MTENPSPILAKTRPDNLFDVAALLLYPPLLALLNSNWIFTPPKLTPDPWFYLGYFRYWPQYAPSFPSYQHYFVERITWNVPGYMIYQLLPPEWANYTLHLLVAWTALLSLYGVLRLLVSRRAGLFAALLMGGYPYFLRAVGWDYTDGTGLAQFLLLLFLLVLAARVPRRGWLLLVAAGVVQASLLITNVFWLGFTPVWLALYLFALPADRRRALPLLRAAGWYLLGGLLLTAAAALHYHALTGDFFFLRNTWINSTRLTASQENLRAVQYIYGWMPPYWHVLPLLACLLAALRLARRPGRWHAPLLLFAAGLAWCYGWFFLFHFRSIPYLIIYSYCSYLIPAAFLLLGVLAAPALEGWSERAFRGLALAGVLLLALPLVLSWALPGISLLHGNITIMWIALILLLTAWQFLQHRGIYLLALAGFALLFYQGGINIGVYLPERTYQRDNFRMVIDAAQMIDRAYPRYNHENFRLWYRDEPQMISAFSLASLYLYPWGSAVVPYPAPALEWPSWEPVYPGDVILLTNETPPEEFLAQANALLAERGARLVLRDQANVANGSQNMTLLFTRLETEPLRLAYGERIEFDQPLKGARNFFEPEQSDGRTFMWSGGPRPRSELRFALPPPGSDLRVTFCALTSLRPSAPEMLRLYVNDVPVALEHTSTPECPLLFAGRIPAGVVSAPDATTLFGLQLDAIYSPEDLDLSDDRRRLGLALDWFVLEELP